MNCDLPCSVTLTDSPRVVALKREFFALDGETEDLKTIIYSSAQSSAVKEVARAILQTIIDRKAEIGALIFKPKARAIN